MAYNAIYRQWLAARETQPAGTTIFAAPLWPDLCALTAAVAATATSLPVTPTERRDFRTEVLLITCDPATGTILSESATIDTVSANQITLTAGLTNAFPAGAHVYPLVRGRVTATPQATFLAPGIVTLPLTVVEDLAAIGDSAYTATAPTYRGIPIFPLVTAWHESPTAALDLGAKATATGVNREAWGSTRDYARLGGDFAVMPLTHSGIAALVRFFLDRRGRWNRFWLPVPAQLTTPAANIGAGDTTITINDFAGFAALYNASGSRNVMICVSDGFRVWLRRVTGLNSGSNQITIDAALGTGLTAGFCMIWPLKLVRFATDDLVLQFTAPRLATAKLAFAEAEKEYSEALATGGTFNGVINQISYTLAAA